MNGRTTRLLPGVLGTAGADALGDSISSWSLNPGGAVHRARGANVGEESFRERDRSPIPRSKPPPQTNETRAV